MMAYVASQRNYDGIQFEKIRRAIEQPFNDEHDRLSAAYYGKTEYVACDGTKWGILDKETFDKLHGLLFVQLQIAFHEHNLALPQEEQVPQEQYNPIDVLTAKSAVQIAQDLVAQLRADGVSLEIAWQDAEPITED